MTSNRFLALVRALLLTSGKEALARGLPAYMALLVLFTIVFAGNGLDAATVVAAARDSVWVRVTLYAFWVLFTSSTLRSLFTPRAAFLRALPIPVTWVAGILALLVWLAELPWLAMWARGGGWLSGFAAGAIAGGLSLSALQPAWHRRVGGAGLCLLVLAAGVPDPWQVAVGVGTLLWGTRSVWLAPPHAVARTNHFVRLRSRLLVLMLANIRIIWRSHLALLCWGAGATFLAAMLAGVGLSRSWSGPGARLAVVLALTSTAPGFLSIALARALFRSEQKAAWVFCVSATSDVLRRIALLLSCVWFTTLQVVLFSALLLLLAEPDPNLMMAVLAQGALLAAAQAMLAAQAVRLLVRGRPRDSHRILLLTVAICALGIALPLGQETNTWQVAALLIAAATCLSLLPWERRSLHLVHRV